MQPLIPLMVVVFVSALCPKAYTDPTRDLPTESKYECAHMKHAAQVSTNTIWANFGVAPAVISVTSGNQRYLR